MRSMALSSLSKRQSLTAYMLLAPAFVLYALIVLAPVADTVFLSFVKWNGLNPVKEFVGFANYQKALGDPSFFAAFANNLIWLALFVTVPVAVALLLGIGMTARGVKGRDQLQAVYFIPYVLSPVVIAVIWKLIYSPNVGILSWLLQAVGIVSEPYGILGDSNFALFGLIGTHIWNQFGFCAVVYVNALQNIDPELYDAANIDGANAVQKLIHVTLPGVSTVTTFLVLLNMINAFRTFNFVFLMTSGGPVQATEVVAYKVYVEAFQLHKVGYGSSLAVMLSVVVLVVGMFYVTLRERKLADNQ